MWRPPFLLPPAGSMSPSFLLLLLLALPARARRKQVPGGAQRGRNAPAPSSSSSFPAAAAGPSRFPRSRPYCRVGIGFHLQLHPDGRVDGAHDASLLTTSELLLGRTSQKPKKLKRIPKFISRHLLPSEEVQILVELRKGMRGLQQSAPAVTPARDVSCSRAPRKDLCVSWMHSSGGASFTRSERKRILHGASLGRSLGSVGEGLNDKFLSAWQRSSKLCWKNIHQCLCDGDLQFYNEAGTEIMLF